METQVTEKNTIETPEEKSWGDKFKRAVFGISTYAGLNGIVNLVISALVAYFVERRYEESLRNGAKRVGGWISSHIGGNAERLGNAFTSGTMSVVLGSGGWMLLAPIKWLEDRRRRIEFRIGHTLDRLQEALGQGNSASKTNLADYEKINTALDQKVEFKADEKERLIKHRIDIGSDGKIAFREHRLPWYKIFASRVIALFTTSYGPGAVYGYVGLTGKEGILERSAPKVTRAISKVFPWYTRIFADADLLSKELAMDTLLTATVATAHKLTQDILHHDSKEERDSRSDRSRKSFAAREEEAKANSTSMGVAV